MFWILFAESFAGRLIRGVTTFTALMFSDFEGNNPEFSYLKAEYTMEYINVQARLSSAFENDFHEVFKSGEEVRVLFDLRLSSGDDVFEQVSFQHTLQFDPVLQYFTVWLSEQQYELTAYDMNELVSSISYFDYSHPIDPEDERYRSCEVSLSARLPVIDLDTYEEEFDLMLLWKDTVPEIETRVVRHESSF